MYMSIKADKFMYLWYAALTLNIVISKIIYQFVQMMQYIIISTNYTNVM